MGSDIKKIWSPIRNALKVVEDWSVIWGLFFLVSIMLAASYGSPSDIFETDKDLGVRLLLSKSEDLREEKLLKEIPSNLSEAPLPFYFETKKGGIEYLESRHVTSLRCKRKIENLGSDTWAEIGSVSNKSYKPAGGLSRYKLGYKFEAKKGEKIFCVQESTGPAKIRVTELSREMADRASVNFAEQEKGLNIAFALMIVFSLINSVINRNKNYAIFALMLFLNYRLAQLSNNSDMFLWWINFNKESMPKIRIITTALVLLVTYYLNTEMLSTWYKELPKPLYVWSKVTKASVLMLLALGTVLSFKTYLPLLWLCTINLGMLLIFRSGWLGYLYRKIGLSPMVISLGLSLTVLFAFSEVAAAALGFSDLMAYINHQSGAIVTSWVAALSFAFQLKEQAKSVKKAKEVLNESYKSSPMGLFLADKSGLVLQANPALLSKFGEKSESGWLMLDHFAGQWDPFVDNLTKVGVIDTEIEVLSNDGTVRWFDLRAKWDDAGQIEGALVDSTERVLHKKRLEFLASHDPLTECLNMRGLEKLINELDKSGKSAAVAAYIDLDRFKLVNDVYGHEAGDQVLKEVKKRLISKIDGYGELCRVGGDEFLIFFKDTQMDQAQTICQKALDSLSETAYIYGDKSFRISASVGIVEAKAIGASTSRALIGAADSACRMAKQKGEGSLIAYGRDSMFFDRRMESFEIAKMLSQDELPEGLYVLAQPIMSLSTPFDSLNFEVLIRFKMQNGKEIEASALVETAEVHGQVAKLDFWVLEKMICWIKDHASSLSLTRFICVNLSGGSLNDEAFLAKVFDLFEKNKVQAQFLCIEITEGVALRDLANTRKFVEKCRDLGVKVALDDFGAGYSSFGYLKELPADALKIDGMLVKDGLNNEATQSILVALSGLSKALGMRTIGEWAENCQMVKMLSMAGFDYVQGYALAKPMPLEDLIKARSSADLIVDAETATFAKYLQQGAPNQLLEDSIEEAKWLH